jgi:glycerol-3-phosphate dehydrogenase
VNRPTSLNAARRQRELADLDREPVDVLVIGGGVTGAGVALDAASRGLRVVLAEKHDLAFGTSRWSSKLVHGGLRYLASGAVGIAHESAVERGVLMTRTAPHLVHPLAQVVPLLPGVSRRQAALIRAGFAAGDALRVAARTPGSLLPRSRRIGPDQVRRYAPTVAAAGLRGGLLNWDGQLCDDARLVVALARTAAGHGASILTRCAAVEATGHGAVLRDELTGTRVDVDARAVINATGVWAGQLAPEVHLRPSRGTHVVLPAAALGGPTGGLTVPVPGTTSRFVFALPAPDGRVYLGLTDEDAPGPVPDVPLATEAEIAFLLDTLNTVLDVPVRRTDVLGSFAGLRPLLDGSGGTSDLSRRHAVLRGSDGMLTVVGGKLTTYRRMAEDAVDAAVDAAGLTARPCVTTRLPLVGAAFRDYLARLDAPAHLVRRYGTEAVAVLAEGLAEPVCAGVATTVAELRFAVRHEGALDVGDLLDRRTRVGLDPVVREAARPAAEQALAGG